MITSIIIDDEKNAREAFKNLIDRYLSDKLKLLALCDSVQSGLEAIKLYQPDIVFLDVEMPEENGFALFKYFKNIHFEVVFTTAYDKYAMNAFKYSALDYLLKPINYIELREVINKYSHKKDIMTQQERIELLLSNLNMGNLIKFKIALPTLSGYEMEKINNIIYCEADTNYTKIYTLDKRCIVVSKTLKYVESILPEDCFFRIHKSFLINLNFIDSYTRVDGHRVKLENGIELDVATRRIDEFVKKITNWKPEDQLS